MAVCPSQLNEQGMQRYPTYRRLAYRPNVTARRLVYLPVSTGSVLPCQAWYGLTVSSVHICLRYHRTMYGGVES